MRRRLGLIGATLVIATLLVSGCALPQRTPSDGQAEMSIWRGRLAIRIESDATTKPQAFSAGFELTGNPQTGTLTLFTPLGSTAAALLWSPQTAQMRTHGEMHDFDSLDALIRQAVGTDIPVAALFAWLAGDNRLAAGWRADLSQHAQGRITAQRTHPTPFAELRLILEK